MSDRDRSSPTLIETTGLKSLLGRDNYPLIGGANGKKFHFLLNLKKEKITKVMSLVKYQSSLNF